MSGLRPGDVLSYSAASTQLGPHGYRKLTGGTDTMTAVATRWPDVARMLVRPPLVINAYPAALGRFDAGIFVDTYLSERTAWRALQLAKAEGLPAILIGQPLFVAGLLHHYVERSLPLPDVLLVAVGGYPLPLSLGRFIGARCRGAGVTPVVLQFYGAAEVDAACLMARFDEGADDLVYFPRGADVKVEIEATSLLLTRFDACGAPIVTRFATGDTASPERGGYVIRNDPSRVDPGVLSELERWTDAEWSRRTGYVARAPGLTFQLRDGVTLAGSTEVSHFGFAERFGFSWLSKPRWS